MPKALTMHRTVVTPGDRARFLEAARAKARHYEAASCHYWLFEEAALAGAFIEFCEAPDAATLTAAHAAVPGRILDRSRVYTSVELT